MGSYETSLDLQTFPMIGLDLRRLPLKHGIFMNGLQDVNTEVIRIQATLELSHKI